MRFDESRFDALLLKLPATDHPVRVCPVYLRGAMDTTQLHDAPAVPTSFGRALPARNHPPTMRPISVDSRTKWAS